MTNEVALDDIYYIYVVKERNPQVYELAQRVFEESQKMKLMRLKFRGDYSYLQSQKATNTLGNAVIFYRRQLHIYHWLTKIEVLIGFQRLGSLRLIFNTH